MDYGYRSGCCKEHMNKWNHIQIKKSVQNKYGVDNIFQCEDIKDKIKNTCIEKYGVEYTGQCVDKKENTKKTCMKKFGVEFAFQNKEIINKIQETCLKKYGFKNPAQNNDIYDKTQKNSLKLKQFKNTNIYYQGSYELDFLEKYYDTFSEIKRSPSVRYNFENKQCVYHPDFIIPSLNLVIECKNSWLMKRDQSRIKAKKKSIIDNGFRYIIIIDKDYSDFNSFLTNFRELQ